MTVFDDDRAERRLLCSVSQGGNSISSITLGYSRSERYGLTINQCKPRKPVERLQLLNQQRPCSENVNKLMKMCINACIYVEATPRLFIAAKSPLQSTFVESNFIFSERAICILNFKLLSASLQPLVKFVNERGAELMSVASFRTLCSTSGQSIQERKGLPRAGN